MLKPQGQEDHQLPQTKIPDLIQVTGNDGCYQLVIVAICFFLVIQSGMVHFASAYNFAVAPYDQCHPPHQGVSKCTQYVCSLPYSQRAQYQNPQIAQLKTLGNQFGDYRCGQEYLVSMAMGSMWVGGILASLVVSWIADNFGRRLSLLLAQLIMILGCGFILLSSSLLLAAIGIFIVGCGVQSSFCLVFGCVIQLVSEEKRSKYQMIIQMGMPLGGAFNILMYYFFKNYQVVFFYGSFVPSIIFLALSWYFLRQTPQFLVKLYSPEEIHKELLFIAKLNNKAEQFQKNHLVSVHNLRQLKKRYDDELKGQPRFTVYSLYEFASLRKSSVCTGIFWLCNGVLYYVPFLLVSQFGLNFYLNGLLFDVAELFSYIPMYFAINHIRRKRFLYINLSIVIIGALVLTFVGASTVCTGSHCSQLQMVLQAILYVLLFFCSGLAINLLVVYTYELFPIQISAIGFGVGQTTICIPNIFNPSLILWLNSMNVPVTVLFMVFGAIMMVTLTQTQETYGKEPVEMIKELDAFHQYDD